MYRYMPGQDTWGAEWRFCAPSRGCFLLGLTSVALLWPLELSRTLFGSPTFFAVGFVVFCHCFWLQNGIILFVFCRAMQHVQIVVVCRRPHDFSCFEDVFPGRFWCLMFAVIFISFVCEVCLHHF